MDTTEQKRALLRSNIVSDLSTSRGSNSSILSSDVACLAPGSGGLEFENNGRIRQNERLFTARPRYTPKAKSQKEVYKNSSVSRGTHAYIKLLTSETLAAKYSSSRGVREGDDLTGQGSIVSRMVSNRSDTGYDSFMLARVSCQLQEKLQVTEVFGDGEVAYYFGRQPIVFDISGVLVDSPDNSWFTDWLRMYSSILRGSQLAQNQELLRLVLPNMTLTGTISSTNWSQDSSNDVAISFGFQFLAKRVEPTAAVLQNVTADDLGGLIDFTQASKYISQQNINSFKSQIASLESAVSSPNSTIASLGSALSGLGSGIGGGLGAVGSTLGGVASSVREFVTGNAFSVGLANTASLFRTLSANLNGIRAQLFSPIYGVLTSLTKLVNNTVGDISSIFNSLFSPVRNILRDITNISNQAIGLVNLVNSSILGVGRNLSRQIGSTRDEFNQAIKSIGRAAGSIATSPQTVLQSVQSLISGGSILPSAAFLRDNRSASLSSAAGARAGMSRKDYKLAILRGLPPYSAKAGARL